MPCTCYNNITITSWRLTRQPFWQRILFSMAELHSPEDSPTLYVGSHAVDVTPRGPTFLYGYPNVSRVSVGANDPLLASAMYVSDGNTAVLFVSVDVIWLSKQFVAKARER